MQHYILLLIYAVGVAHLKSYTYPMSRRRGGQKRNTGKPFEDKVAEAIRSLYPYDRVETDVRLPAIITEGKRQVDTLLNRGGILTDFDAKDHRRNIGIDTIAAYDFKLKDEQVPNGVIVSNSPYATSAVNAAKHLNVRLTHLINTADKENPFKIAQKTLVTDTFVNSLSFGIRHMGIGEGISIDRDLGKAVLIGKTGERATAYEVFRLLWNEGTLLAEKVGYHRYTFSKQKVVMSDGTERVMTEFHFDYIVDITHHYGEWAIKQAEGLYDVTKGSFTTNKDILSAALSAKDVSSWPIITREEAQKRGFAIEVFVISELPEVSPEMVFDD
jgi:hypothetical protein